MDILSATPESVDKHLDWIKNNWKLSFLPVVVYVSFLVIGSKFMKDRSPFKLKNALGLWSFGLTILSFLGSMNVTPTLISNVMTHGIIDSICHYRADASTSMWVIVFVWSKIPELIDTVFIVLRKQKLIFLHYYHHLLTVMYCFHSLSSGFHGALLWVVSLNYTVHVTMYAYFTIRAFKLCRVPSIVNLMITSSQIVQMFILVVIYGLLWIYKLTNWRKCDIPLSSVYMGFFTLFSYLILFINFFHKSYISQPRPSSKGE
jgi:elongation of very long chain fatty acids protein 6